MASKRRLASDNEALKNEISDLRDLLAYSVETSRIGVFALAESLAPTEADLKKFAEDFPMWSIQCKTVEDGWNDDGRKIAKYFERDISDLHPDLQQDRETYLRLADVEYFDRGLIDTFSMTSSPETGYISGNGSYSWSGDGHGGSITIGIEGESSITKLDLIRVKAAEQYLTREGLFTEPVAA